MRLGLSTAAILTAAAITAGPAATQGTRSAGVLPSTFHVRTVSDLATLCGASPGQTNAEAATYLCHGFLMGVGQYHAATHPPGGEVPPLFCPPNPPPTVAQAAASFAAWARSNPQFANDRAVDGLTRWAQASFPCRAATTSRRR